MTTSASAFQESAKLDFKASFEIKTDWCELIKDIVAMANSGGGKILIGVSDDGVPSKSDVSALLAVDLADVVNKIAERFAEGLDRRLKHVEGVKGACF